MADKNIVTVKVPQQTYDRIAQTCRGTNVSEEMGIKAAVLLDNIASGGMILTPDQVRRIEQVTGKTISRGADVISCVEAANDIEDGCRRYPVRFDPIWEEPLKQRALEAGRDPEDLLSDAFQEALANNWIFGFTPKNGPIFLTDRDLKYWQDRTGKQAPFGADITAAAQKEPVAA